MSELHIIIIGGGILGAQHALLALELGHSVTLIERDPYPRSASVRNFGLVWLSGRRPGPEMDLARRSRTRWEHVARDVSGIDFRPAGSLTCARTDEEVDLLTAYTAQAESRGLDVALLSPEQIRKVAPAVRGNVRAAAFCRDDAIVEPRFAAPTLMRHIASHPKAHVDTELTATAFHATNFGVRVDTTAGPRTGDVLIGCPGAEHHGLFSELLENQPLIRCRLEMLETAPLPLGGLPVALADGDSMRYYPGFSELPEAATLPPADPLVQEQKLQLLVAPRLDGTLTIGDSHLYDEPFSFDLTEKVANHWLATLEDLLGAPAPAVTRRWSGVYSKYTGGDGPYLRVNPLPNVHVVTGVAGMGMTVSAGVALDTMEYLK